MFCRIAGAQIVLKGRGYDTCNFRQWFNTLRSRRRFSAFLSVFVLSILFEMDYMCYILLVTDIFKRYCIVNKEPWCWINNIFDIFLFLWSAISSSAFIFLSLITKDFWINSLLLFVVFWTTCSVVGRAGGTYVTISSF